MLMRMRLDRRAVVRLPSRLAAGARSRRANRASAGQLPALARAGPPSVPTLVIHGTEDRILPFLAG
jgi:pimeloyl-ACP methyl ester carboxylesterase